MDSLNSLKKLYSDPTVVNLSELNLQDKIRQLEKENFELRFSLEAAGGLVSQISDTEFICLQQLKHLKEISNERQLDKSEAIILDLLHKNLLVARNIPISKKNKEKKKSVEELLRIVGSN